MRQKRYWILWGLLFSLPVIANDLVSPYNVNYADGVYQGTNDSVGQSVQISYVWSDFLQGKSCNDDFNRLNTLEIISQKQQFLKDKMQAYCITQKKGTIWSGLLSTFRKSKKNLLIDKILKEEGTFWKYAKVVPYFLFDIHNTHPVGNTLNDKLDLIQNAIQNKDPEMVLLQMQELSPVEQLYLNSVFNEISILLDFKNALEERNAL